ncbi:unnamed protein product, partial [Closterium sp. NIES-54]
ASYLPSTNSPLALAAVPPSSPFPSSASPPHSLPPSSTFSFAPSQGLILGPFALPDCVPAYSPSAPSPTHTILSSPILTPSPFQLPPASIFPTSQPHLAPTLHARFANYIGKLPADQLTTLLDLLFSPSMGIGFNLARYLLGASFNATNSPQLTKDTMHQTNLPGYKPSKAALYDWAADWR